MIKISSIVIAKNEEKNIARCILSQQDVIDEIIVIIDDESSDKTLEIVKKLKVVYYIEKWRGYSQTKQFALEKITNEWVLWIDADEAITKGLSDEIKSLKKSIPSYVAYSIPRKAFFLGKWIKHSGWYPGRVVRLFRKDNGRFDNKEVHEGLIIEGKIGKLKNDLEHYTDPDINHYYAKFNRYTSIAADQLHESGKKFKIMDILFRPIIIFVKMYILKLGFLDGIQGFILSVFSANYVFVKYCKLWERNGMKFVNRK